MSDARQKTFHAGLTRDFVLLASALLISGLCVVELGFIVEREFSGRGIFFFVLGGLLLAGIFLLLYHVTGCFIVVTPDEITYQDRWTRVTIPWADAADFHAPPAEQKWFRKAHLLNDRRQMTISSLSFAKFDTILSVIRIARRSKFYHEDTYSA